MPDVIASNLAAVRAEIAAACQGAGRDPATVRLIAVTKSQGPEVLPRLAAAGVLDYGENRVDHLELMVANAPAGARFHAIGRIQGRQLADTVRLAQCLHSLCDPGHVDRFAKAIAAAGFTAERRYPVFVQVNTSGESAKAGLPPDALPAMLDRLRAIPACVVEGLMTMAPDLAGNADESGVRRCFAACRELAARHGLKRLSMGMSGDFALAVAEGATEIRVGTRLFVPSGSPSVDPSDGGTSA